MSEWRWSAKSELAALALAEGKTWKQIEADVGISHQTLARWVKIPEFQARIDAHVEDIVEDARRIIRRNAAKAAQRMADAMQYATPRHSAQIAAAKDVLDRSGLKPTEKQQIEQSGDMTIRVVYAKPDDDR